MTAKPALFEIHVRLCQGRHRVFGPGKCKLLRHITRSGSLAEAAKAMDMSYMRAWNLVQAMNREWGEPLVELRRGGDQRGGATLTATGRKVLGLYEDVVTTSEQATRGLLRQLAGLR
jgi:molybdate transport system regulatory protein